MSNPLDYSVGCICALPEESAALQAFLDARHDSPKYVSTNDNNDYTLGRIGAHNVVICVLPSNQYGLVAAATVARDLAHSFPNIRIGLMVGIAGGAPSPEHDVRLGDVVVGVSSNGNAAVFQYDYGKSMQGRDFLGTGFLNQAPQILLTAVNGLKTYYEVEGICIEEAVNSALRKKPRMQQKYQRPDASTDRLYQSNFIHQNESADCATACGSEDSRLRKRKRRLDDGPAIHYGPIASSNSLMKDALLRDELVQKKDVLCFEMEAAGLMNHFPCLIIRGICDYSDSHKNKKWQGYAAMNAAAYTRDLLSRIAPSRIEAERKIGDIYSDVKRDVHEHLNIAKQQLQLHEHQAKEKISKEERDCHQLFYLTNSERDITYKWYKDRLADRVEGTCLWFLEHENFIEWLHQESGPLLVSADPGCGKSVLAKYLIDRFLPQESCICYFFFKDQDQYTMRQALCALIHQLFLYRPALIKHATAQLDTDGKNMIHSTASLWEILENAIKDPQSGSVIVVLDALDECAEPDLLDLATRIGTQFSHDQTSYSRLRWLLTCRPYEQTLSKFYRLLGAFPKIHVPGEDESEAISREVNRVISYRVDKLSNMRNLSAKVKNHLERTLRQITHRTYLWVHLVFDYLENESFKKTERGVDSAITTLPRSVSEAYEQILHKSTEKLRVRNVLCIILAARVPLSLSAMNAAMSVNYASKSIDDLDLEEDANFRSRLREWCGLFISIHGDKVYLLHQSAREFLLADSQCVAVALPGSSWHHSITATAAHHVLAELCVMYLNLFNSAESFSTRHVDYLFYKAGDPFFLYAAAYWGDHFRAADVKDEDHIVHLALRICNTSSQSYGMWSSFNWVDNDDQLPFPQNLTDLMVASYLGHRAAAVLMLKRGDNIEARGDNGQTALSLAACKGFDTIVKLLLDNGADPNVTDFQSCTPLYFAILGGSETVIELLLRYGANVKVKAGFGLTPLSISVDKGNEAIVKLLLDSGADPKARDDSGWTPLLTAVMEGNETIAKLLLNSGADTEASDIHGNTPLLLSVWLNRMPGINRNIIKDFKDIKVTDKRDCSMIFEAAKKASRDWIEELDQFVDARDRHTSDDPYMAIVQHLLSNGANIEAKDSDGRTPLLVAARERCRRMIRLLLDNGANVEARGPYGRTPVFIAAAKGSQKAVQLLAERGAKLDVADDLGNTPLSLSVANGHEDVVRELHMALEK